MNDPQPTERRVAVRWTSSQQTPCHFATLERISARWATVLDVSLQGIGLLLPCEFNPGTELVLELPCKDLASARVVIAFVVHSRPHSPETWVAGCTFDRPLTQDELDTLR